MELNWSRSTGRLFTFLVVLSLMVSGCKSLARRAFAQPVVTLRDIRLASLTQSGGTLEVVIGVYNPNGYRLDATRMTYRLMMDSTELGRGSTQSTTTIQAGDSAVARLPIGFTFAGLGEAARRLQASGALDYRLLGELTVATPLGPLTHPYDQRGRFSLLVRSSEEEY